MPMVTSRGEERSSAAFGGIFVAVIPFPAQICSLDSFARRFGTSYLVMFLLYLYAYFKRIVIATSLLVGSPM